MRAGNVGKKRVSAVLGHDGGSQNPDLDENFGTPYSFFTRIQKIVVPGPISVVLRYQITICFSKMPSRIFPAYFRIFQHVSRIVPAFFPQFPPAFFPTIFPQSPPAFSHIFPHLEFPQAPQTL